MGTYHMENYKDIGIGCDSVYLRQKPWKGTMFSSSSFQKPPGMIHSALNRSLGVFFKYTLQVYNPIKSLRPFGIA